MTITKERMALSPLRGSDVPVHATYDVRGYHVYDTEGEEVGRVDDLICDTTGGIVRMLRLKGGGIFGLGDRRWLVPVEALGDVAEDAVQLDRARDELFELEDREALDDGTFVENVYRHYGATPFWAPGYSYPDWQPRVG